MKKGKQALITRHDFDQQFRGQAETLGLDVDVLSEGPLDATIAFVGEGPGESEVRKGRPFVGGAGNLLFNSVGKYNIHRTGVYTTNVVKRQISVSSRSDEGRKDVPADEMRKWEETLRWELGHMPNLQTVFALGGNALRALTGHEGIMKWRGSVLSDQDLPNGKKGSIVCTINPAYAARELSVAPFFTMDCHKLHMVNSGVFKKYLIEEIINPSYKEARAWLRDMMRSKEAVALDVEHYNDETTCYGLTNDPHKAMCINFRDEHQNRYSLQEEYDIMNDIQRLCESQRIIAQSGGHETYWLWYKDRIKVKIWFDTLLGHHTLYPRWPHDLGFLTTQYTTHPYYKDEFYEWTEKGGDIDTQWRYNCKDAAITKAVQVREEKELRSQGLHDFFMNHVMRAQPHLASATVHGVRVDEKIKAKVVEMCQKDVDAIRDEFWRLCQEATGIEDYEPNHNSPPQMRELLFEMLNLSGKGKSTDKANRQYIVKQPTTSALSKEIITTLDKLKQEDKFLGTYANARTSADGRMRCDYKQFGVARAPGRLSASQLVTGEGMNLQNVPVRARAQFVADEDMCFVYFDGSQAEARIVAYRANIPKWKEQFEKARLDGKYDCHRALCSEMFNIPYDETPKDDWDENDKPTKRYVAKRCRHGLNYRMERGKLAEVTQLPYHEASRAFILYHKITPELEKWWKAEEKRFKEERAQFNAFGRRNKVIQAYDDDVLDSIIAFYPQSTVGDWITKAWYMIEEDDDWPINSRICLDVHDNLVGITPIRYAKTALKVMKKHAETPILIENVYKDKPEKLIIPAEFKVSYPSVPVIDKKTGKLSFERDPKGLHRWSHMDKVQL